jgi:methylated-DNA-[protein]-cysteine S-methyltransferase
MQTEFQNKVYEIVKRIPKGKLTTYKAIAEKLNSSPRAIGRALNANKNPVIIPCHRVIKSDGTLGGYKFGIKRKKELLKKEGLTKIFSDYIISDF